MKFYIRSLVGAVALLSTVTAQAATKLYSPYVEKGEWELEYFGSRSHDSRAGKDDKQKHLLAIGYGVNDWWKTEIYAIFEKSPQDQTRFDAVEWENIFQITQQGEYWLDVGASLAYEHTPQDSHADVLESRLLLAKDIGRTLHVANLIVEKEVASGPKASAEGELLWSSRYLYLPVFEPGFEIFSKFGELDDTGGFDDQEHYIGPAAYGKIPLHWANGMDALKYRAGYYWGISDAASDGDAFVELEYEIRF